MPGVRALANSVKKDCITRDRQPSFLLTYLSGSYNCTFFHLLLAFVLIVRKIFSQSLFMIFVQTFLFLLHRCFSFFIASVFILLHLKIFVNQFSIVGKIFSANMTQSRLFIPRCLRKEPLSLAFERLTGRTTHGRPA